MPETKEVAEPEPSSEWLLPGVAAAMLGVTTTTLGAWAEIGAIESIRLPTGHRRYLAASVHAIANRRASA